MNLNIPIEDTIKKRVSVRSFESKDITAEEKQKLMECAANLTNPFGVEVRIHLVDRETSANGEKLGTYGIIKGAKTYLGVSSDHGECAPEAIGYQFESMILYATYLGLGTVWIAGTLRRDEFKTAMGIKDEEIFAAISPVGYAAKRRVKENIMRMSLKADQRKPWDQLFYKDTFEQGLTKQDAKEYADPLEMLRLAPSAANGQPWRVVLKDGVYHFFESYHKNTSQFEVFIKRVDVGIGVCHFHQTAMAHGLKGEFTRIDPEKLEIKIPEYMKYIVSWNPVEEDM